MKNNNSALSSKALLISVNISQWNAKKQDKTATNTVIKSHKTERVAGIYNKNLMPMSKELDLIVAHCSAVRRYFYEQTLPWFSDGSRIISAKNHLKFSTEMRKMKSEFETRVNDFIAAYPRLQNEAKARLGDLYNAAEYPAANEIKSKFSLDVNYMPLPDVTDFRTEISDAEKNAFIKKIKEVEAKAMRECWERLYSVVKTASDKLKQPDAILRDSLIENINELCQLMPMLNVADDSNLENARLDIQKALKAMPHTEILRYNKTERDKAQKKLDAISNAMGAFMGVPK